MQDAIILYENGKAIGGEGHPTDADDITFDNTGTDLVSENVENAIKEVNAKTSGLTRMTKLWENPSPTASFVAQQITLASDDYDFWEAECAVGYGANPLVCTFKAEKGQNLYANVAIGNGNQVRSRSFNYVNDTKISVETAYYNGTASDNYVIPLKIYGIKLI